MLPVQILKVQPLIITMITLNTRADLTSKLTTITTSKWLEDLSEQKAATWKESLKLVAKEPTMTTSKTFWSSDSEVKVLASKKAQNKKNLTNHFTSVFLADTLINTLWPVTKSKNWSCKSMMITNDSATKTTWRLLKSCRLRKLSLLQEEELFLNNHQIHTLQFPAPEQQIKRTQKLLNLSQFHQFPSNSSPVETQATLTNSSRLNNSSSNQLKLLPNNSSHLHPTS